MECSHGPVGRSREKPHCPVGRSRKKPHSQNGPQGGGLQRIDFPRRTGFVNLPPWNPFTSSASRCSHFSRSSFASSFSISSDSGFGRESQTHRSAWEKWSECACEKCRWE